MLRHGLHQPVRRASIRCTRITAVLKDPITKAFSTSLQCTDDTVMIPRPTYRRFPRPETAHPRNDRLYNKVHADIGINHFTLLASFKIVRPEWRLVRLLANAPEENYILSKTLNECRIPIAQYNHWKPVIMAPTFGGAMALVKPSPNLPPRWLLFHLFANRTTSLEDALQAVDTILSLQSNLDPDTLAACIILTTHALAHVRADAVVRPIVVVFLRPEVFDHVLPFYVNAMLVAISRYPSSEVLAPLILTLVRALHARGVKLQAFAVEHLLASKSNSLEITQRVHQILQATARDDVDRALVQDYITVLQKEGAPGSVAQVLTALIADDTAAAAEAAAAPPGSASTFPPHFPPNLPAESFAQMTVFDWISYVSQAARDKHVLADTLLELYAFAQQSVARDAAHKASNLVSLRRKLLPALLAGLARRGEPGRAVKIWDEYVAKHLSPSSSDPLKLDRHILGAGLNALSRAGHVTEALETLDALALRVGEAGYVGGRSAYEYPSYDADDPTTPHPRVPLTSIALNAFLDALLGARRPDAIFALWDIMEPAWGVAPDGRTLDLLLQAAALAGRMHATRPVREELAYIRFRVRALLPWGRRTRDSVAPRGSKDDPVRMVRAMLAAREVQSTLWRGVPAWQRARYVFRSVALGNWPELEDVVPPAYALREGEPVEFAYADHDPASWHTSKDDDAADDSGSDKEDVPAVGITPAPRNASNLLYPATTPSAKTFHLYISLLGQSGLASEIAQALVWMRHLGLLPTTDTIALAMVYWRTVTDDAPSVEIYKDLVNRKKTDQPESDAIYGSAYIALVKWLHDWVPGRMPTEEQIRALDHYTRAIIRHDAEEVS